MKKSLFIIALCTFAFSCAEDFSENQSAQDSTTPLLDSISLTENDAKQEFSEILSVSHALPHRGQYPQSEYGRHLQFVQAAGKNAQANCVCSGAHCAAVGGFAALRMRRAPCGL